MCRPSMPPCPAAKRSTCSPTSAIIASNVSRLTVTPPKRSASVTTPIGIEIQALISGCGGPCRLAAPGPSRTSSEEPPPMSNRITPAAAGSSSGVQPVAASSASVSRSTISSSMPTSLRMRSRNSQAVAGGAAGLGGDQPRAGDAAVAHLGAAHPERIDGAQDRRLAQHARTGDALAEPDDAGERVDDAEAVAAWRAPPAAGNCWCRDRALRRSGRTRPAPRRGRHHGGRDADADTATAAGARAPVGRGAEAGCPGLVVHRKPFPAPKLEGVLCPARRRGGDLSYFGAKCR